MDFNNMAETQASIPETGSFSLTEENSQEVLKDLKKVLSRDAVISLASSEEFVKSNLRFTSYERPVSVSVSLSIHHSEVMSRLNLGGSIL